MLKILAIAAAFSAALYTSAIALTFGEAQKLVSLSNVEALEKAFQEHQDAFKKRAIGPEEFKAPFGVFRTTEPKLEEVLAAWNMAYPKSPQALTAIGVRLDHLTMLMAGTELPLALGETGLSALKERSRAAVAALAAALGAEPAQLAAAHALFRQAGVIGDGEARALARATKVRHGDPDISLRDIVVGSHPGWGGSFDDMRKACREIVESAPRVTLRQCDALVGFYETAESPDGGPRGRDGATLASADVDVFLPYRLLHLINIDPKKALVEAGKSLDTYPIEPRLTFTIAYGLSIGLQDLSIAAAISDGILKHDPLNPLALMLQQTAQISSGRIDDSLESMEQALQYGRYWPHARIGHLNALAATPTGQWRLLDELVSASTDTDGDIRILGRFIPELADPPVYFRKTKDGIPREELDCIRLTLLQAHKTACGQNPPSHFGLSCERESAKTRDRAINAMRAKRACGAETKRNWKDVARYLFDLTE